MANINSIITYNANLSPAQAQIKALTGQVAGLTAAFNSLDKSALKAQRSVAATFAGNVGQIGGFTAQTVKATSAVESFGRQLAANKLTMREYFTEALNGYRKQDSMLRRLADQQVRYQQSIAVPIGGGQAMMLTPQSINAASSATQLASQRFSIFNQLVNGGATAMLNWGKNTQWAGRQLMVGFTLPLALFAGVMSKQFRELDKELTRFQKVYGSDLGNAVSESTQRMRDQVQQLAYDISSAYGIAAKETAALAADIAATGREGEDLMASVRQTTRLAVLGEVDRQEAMKATLSLQSAFRMNTNELAESINFLNAVENQTSATLEDLATAIPKVGPVIRSLGGDVKDLATLLVAMREGGIPAAEAANALKSGLASLINPTKQASAVAKSFGVDLVGIVEANRGQLMPTIFAMQDALNGLDSFSRSRIIEQIFGKYQFARISALFDNIGRTGSQTQQVIELATRSSAELAAVANGEIRTLTESTAVKFQRTLENLKNALMPIGQTLTETLVPVLETVGKGVQMFSTFFSSLPDSVKGLAKWGVALTALAGPVIMLVGLFGNLVANGLKFGMMIVRLGAKMAGIKTEKFQLLDENVMAAKLGVDNLTSAFTTQEVAMRRLVGALTAYEQSLGRLAIREPALFIPGAVPVTRAAPPIRRQKGSTAPEKVPGGYGGGDRIPALLEPGESVITKEATAKFWPVIEAMNRGNLPGFNRGALFLGMPRGYKDLQGAKQVRQTLSTTNIEATTGRFAKLPVTDIGTKVTSIGGRSSSIPGVNGIYEQGGNKYVVKTHDTADSALAEVRGTQLTRDIFGLDTPVQELIKIKHPVTGDVIFAVRSPYEAKFASSTGVIDEKNFFGQALAAIVRRDKDLQPDNLYGNIVTDVGQAFVANKASQPRIIGSELPGVAEQTATNFLMSKGGAKKWFAETTAPLARTMSEDDYVRGFQTTIAEAARKARASIDNLPYMTKEERVMYSRIIDDLDEAAKIDWRAVYQSHRGITPEVKKPPTAAALAKKEAQDAEKARQRGGMAQWEYGLPFSFGARGIIVGSGAIIGRGRNQRTHTTPEPIYTTNPDDIPERITRSKRGVMAKDLASAGIPVEVLTDSWIMGPFNQGLKKGVKGSEIIKWLTNLKDSDLGPAYRRAGITSSQLKASLSLLFKNDSEYSQKTFGEIIESAARRISIDFKPQYDSAYIPKPSVLREYEKTLNDKGFELYEKGGRLFVKKIGAERGELSAASYPLTRQEGGIIPGYGGGDIVPAYLEPGEFVIRKEVTRENKAFLENINAGKYRKFQLGGFSGNEPALLEPGEFVVNSDASAQYAPILRAMNRGTIGRYENGRDDVTMRPGYNPNDPKYSSPDKTPTGGQHQGHIFGAPVAPGIPAFGKNLQIGGQAIFWHQDFWKMVTAAENQLANVLAMSAGNRARFMESLSTVGPQFNASQQQIDRIMLAVTNGFMQHEDDVTLYQAALRNLGQRISTGAASVTGSMAGLIKQVESIKITGYSTAEAQAVERRLIAEYQRILSTPGQLAETARIAIAKQLQTVQQQMTATGIATTQMTASLASNIQASAARPFPGGTLVPGKGATQGPQLAGAEQGLTKALQLRERLQLRLIASSERLEKLDAAALRIKADTSLSEQKRKAALDNLTKQYYEELNNNEILKNASNRAEQNLTRAKERAAISYATVQPGGTGGRSGGGDTTFLGMPAIPPRSGATGPDTAMKDPMARMMRGQGLMNVAFMGSMAIGSLGALGVASEDAASKLMLLSTALMALPMLGMMNPKGMATNFMGLTSAGKGLTGLGSRVAGPASAGMATSAVKGTGAVLPTFAASRGVGGLGGGLMMAGRGLSLLGGPVGIAAGLGITAVITGFMMYRNAAEEARERAIAAFNDPVKSAEYFGESIQNVADIIEKNKLANIDDEIFIGVDKALREAVAQDYAPMIEKLKGGLVMSGAKDLSIAYSNMVASGMSADNAKAAVEAIAVEAGEKGGEAFAKAMEENLFEATTVEEAVKNIIVPFRKADETYSELTKQNETRLAALAEEESSLVDLARTRPFVEGALPYTPSTSTSSALENAVLVTEEELSRLKQIREEMETITNDIVALETVDPATLIPTVETLITAYSKAPGAVAQSLNEIQGYVTTLSLDDQKGYIDEINKFLSENYPEDYKRIAGQINTATEATAALKLVTSGVNLNEAITDAGEFNSKLAESLYLSRSLADQYAVLSAESEAAYFTMIGDFAQKQRDQINLEFENFSNAMDTRIELYEGLKETAQEAFEIEQEARQDSISGMQDEMEQRRDAFDEEMDRLDDRQRAIEKSSDAYIKSLEKNQKAESFYSQQRKTSFSALEKLAAGDVFGFLQEREQMSQDAQEYSYDQMISGIEERRDLELDAIDEVRRQKQDEQEEYEQMMEDRIEAVQDLMEIEQEAHDERMEFYDDQIEGANTLRDKRLQAKDEEINGIKNIEQDYRTNSTKAERTYGEKFTELKTKPYIEARKEMTKNAILSLYYQGGITLSDAASQAGITSGFGPSSITGEPFSMQEALSKLGITIPASSMFKEEETPGGVDTSALTQQVQEMTVDAEEVTLNGDIIAGGINLTAATGGYIQNGRVNLQDGGGAVRGPGGPKSDVIPAMLSNGEYVIQASSVRKYGTDLMHTINAGKYATGGYISADRAETAAQGNRYGGIPPQRQVSNLASSLGSRFSGFLPPQMKNEKQREPLAPLKNWGRDIKVGIASSIDAILTGMLPPWMRTKDNTMTPIGQFIGGPEYMQADSFDRLMSFLNIIPFGALLPRAYVPMAYGGYVSADRAEQNATGTRGRPKPQYSGGTPTYSGGYSSANAQAYSKPNLTKPKNFSAPSFKQEITSIVGAVRSGFATVLDSFWAPFRVPMEMFGVNTPDTTALGRTVGGSQYTDSDPITRGLLAMGILPFGKGSAAPRQELLPFTDVAGMPYRPSLNISPVQKGPAPGTVISIGRGIRGARGIAESGKFKNMFETNTTTGSTGFEDRAAIERRGWGIPFNADPSARPIYGLLRKEDEVTFPYGEFLFDVRYDPTRRTSYSPGDTKWFSPPKEGLPDLKQSHTPGKGNMDYAEVWQDNVKLSDVSRAHVAITDTMDDVQVQEILSVAQMLRDKGVPVSIHGMETNLPWGQWVHRRRGQMFLPGMDKINQYGESLMANGGLVQKFADGGLVESMEKYFPNGGHQFYPGWNRFNSWAGGKPGLVMMHHTAGNWGQGELDYFAKDWMGKPVVQGFIRKTGTAHTIAGGDTGLGSGIGDTELLDKVGLDQAAELISLAGSANRTAWQIEVQSLGETKDFTQGQFDAIARMTAAIRDWAGWPSFKGRIINHKDWAWKRGKPDTLYDRSVFEANAEKVWEGGGGESSENNNRKPGTPIGPKKLPEPGRGLYGVLGYIGGNKNANNNSGADTANNNSGDVTFSNIPDGYTVEDANRTLGYIRAGGWPTNLQRLAWSIAMRESGGRNIYDTGDYGIFQLNKPSYGSQPWWISDEKILNDPVYNSSVAYKNVSQSGKNFLPWAMRVDNNGNYSWDWSYYNPRPSWADTTETRTAAFWNSWKYKASGGIMKLSAGGGAVSGPGGPRSDMIPAMLSDGEYVVKASSVSKYGRGFMDRLNAGQLNMGDGGFVPTFASGGMVGNISSPSFNMPEVSNSSVGVTNNNYAGNISSNNNKTNVKVVINGAGGKNANVIANKVISMINSANNRRDHSRSI